MLFEKRPHVLLILALCILLTTGCGPPDPSRKGMVPCFREDKWMGPMVPPWAYDQFDSCVEIDQKLSLGAIVDIALQNNPLTRQSWANARAAAFSWESSKSALYPNIDWQESLNFINDKFGRSKRGGGGLVGANAISGTSNSPSASNKNSDAERASGYQQEVVHSLTLQYLLFDFGGRDADIESARQTLFSYNWTHDRILQQVIDSSMRAYYRLVDAQATLQALSANLEDAKANLDAAEALFSAGLIMRVDVLQAKSAYVSSQLDIEQQKGVLQIAEGQLAHVMGLPANQKVDIRLPPEKLPYDFVESTVEELIELAKSARPDLASAYAAYLQKEAALARARSNGMPTITAGLDFERYGFIHCPKLNSYTYTANITLDIPLFAGFLYTNEVHRVKAEVDYSFGQVQNTKSSICLDVVTSYYNYKTAVETARYSNEYLEYSQEAYDAAYANYMQGTGSVLDTLTAQGVLADARAQWVRARTQWMTTLADLAYATGLL